jgi:N-methylhydantoinase A
VQAVTFRLEAVAAVRRAELHPQSRATSDVSAAITGRRDVWLAEARSFVPCPVYDREKLGPGHQFTGPAVVEQMDATTLVLTGQTAQVDPYLNLIVES